MNSLLAVQSAWPVDRIKNHISKIGSGITPSGGAPVYLDAGVPLLRSQNVHFDGLRLDDVAYIAEETHEEMSGSKLRVHDVLLNITGASIGRCTFVPAGFGEGNVNQHVCIIRLTARLDHKFLTYCLSDAQVQFQVNALRMRFQARITDWEGRRAFVSLLARFVKSFHFLTCFFTCPVAVGELAAFAEYVGPQLVKAGTVSDLMKQVRATLVTKAAVQYQGLTTSGGPVSLKPGKGTGGAGPVPVKVSVQDVIAQIRATFAITDEEALYIRQVTEEKIADPTVRARSCCARGLGH